MSSERAIEWSSIMDGEVVEGGRMVHGVGVVQISDDDAQAATMAGGDPIVELVDATANEIIPVWAISSLIPRDPRLTEQGNRLKRQRAMLQKYYDAYMEDTNQPLSFWTVGSELGLDPKGSETIFVVLSGQGFVAPFAGCGLAFITPDGIKEVENSLRYPSQMSREMRMQMNQTNNISGGNIGNLMMGSNNAATVQQTVGFSSDDVAALLDRVREAISSLPEVEQEAAAEGIDDIEEELTRPKPRKQVFEALVMSLPLAIKASEAMAQLATAIWPA